MHFKHARLQITLELSSLHLSVHWPWYGELWCQTCHVYVRDIDFTHKKWSISYDMTRYIAYFEISGCHRWWERLIYWMLHALFTNIFCRKMEHGCFDLFFIINLRYNCWRISTWRKHLSWWSWLMIARSNLPFLHCSKLKSSNSFLSRTFLFALWYVNFKD